MPLITLDTHRMPAAWDNVMLRSTFSNTGGRLDAVNDGLAKATSSSFSHPSNTPMAAFDWQQMTCY